MSTLPTWRTQAPAGITLSDAMTRFGVSGVTSGPLTAAPASPITVSPLGRQLVSSSGGRWRSQMVESMTPQMVEYTLRNGLSGDLQGQWELFDLMEDTWPRLQKDLNEIKRQVAAMRWEVKPWAEEREAPDSESEQQAKLVSRMLWNMRPVVEHDERDLQGIMYDLLDAWGKGLSVVELVWHQTSDGIAPRAGQWAHPVNYGIDSEGRLGLSVTAGDSTRLSRGGVEPFPEHKFITAIAKGRTTHYCAAAMLRPLAWWWAAANFGASWLLNYAQLFGVPLRWANYSSSAAPESVAKIGEALAGMGSAAWATFPEGTTLQILEGSKGAGSSPQEAIIALADKYCDLLVLGQTLTADAADKGTQALGTVHERVRGDIIQSAADWVAGALNRTLVRSIMVLNFDQDDDLPELVAEPVRERDATANAQRIATILGAGVPVPAPWLYEHLEIPQPKEGEETIGGTPNSQLPTPNSQLPRMPQDALEDEGGVRTPPDPEKVTARKPPRPSVDSGKGGVEGRRADAQTRRQGDAKQALGTVERITWQAVAESIGARTRWLEPLAAEMDRLIEAASGDKLSDAELIAFLESARRKLPDLFGKMDHAALAESLEAAMGAAAVEGLKARLKAEG